MADVVVHHLGRPRAHLRGTRPHFEALGGVPQLVRTDRMGALGTSQGRRFSLHPRRVEFAVHHGTEIKACQAGDAKRKGKIERPFRGLEDIVPGRAGRPRPAVDHRRAERTAARSGWPSGSTAGCTRRPGSARSIAWHASARSWRRCPPDASTPPMPSPAGSTSPCPSSSGTPCATRSRPSASARSSGAGSRWTRASSRSPGAERSVATHRLVAPRTTTCGTRPTARPPRRPPSVAPAVPLHLVRRSARPPPGRTLRRLRRGRARSRRPLRSCRGDATVTAPSPYEQLKDDLGYLQLGPGRGVLRHPRRTGQGRGAGATSSTWPRSMAEQAAATTNRRLAARLRYARFPYVRSLEEFDFDFQPSVDRKLVDDLATLRFIEENRPVVFLGQPGCGKTHLAVALAILAVEAGYRGYFSTADDMVRTLVPGPPGGELRHQAADLHRTVGPGHRRRGTVPDGRRGRRRVLPRGQPPLRERPPHAGDDQPGPARLGRRLRRPGRRRGHPRPAHAPGGRVQHQRTVVAHARAPALAEASKA